VYAHWRWGIVLGDKMKQYETNQRKAEIFGINDIVAGLLRLDGISLVVK